MKERQGSVVTLRFLDRETQWMVLAFTEMGKLEEQKQIFGGWHWGEVKIYGVSKITFRVSLQIESLCIHSSPILFHMLTFELGKSLGSFYPLNKCKK